jgi:hypothetical protein
MFFQQDRTRRLRHSKKDCIPVKKHFDIPVPSRDVAGLIYSIRHYRESLVSDIPVGDGNIEKLFYGV